jgi:hypothetical protein
MVVVEPRLMQTRKKVEGTPTQEELAQTLAAQLADKEERERRDAEMRRQPDGFPFPRMTKGEIP